MRHTEQMSTFSSPLLENTPHSSMNILPILLFKSYELTFNVHCNLLEGNHYCTICYVHMHISEQFCFKIVIQMLVHQFLNTEEPT